MGGPGKLNFQRDNGRHLSKKKKVKKKCTEGPCVVLCGIKNCKNWKRAFSKSTPVYPRLLWTKALPISKKSFFLEKKNLFCLSKLSIKINAPYYIHVFLLYIKDEIYGDRAVFFTIL